MSEPTHFLGVDGGATRCRDAAGAALAEAQRLAANTYVDFDAAIRAIDGVVSGALREAGLPQEARGRVALGLGLAGLSSEADAKRVGAALPGWTRVPAANDAVTACVGARAGADGGLIITGAGSAGIARVDGRTSIAGGRGYLLGDDGAAVRVGADSLPAALRAYDNLEPMSGLSRDLLAHFHNNPNAMTQWVLTAKPNDYCAFAPLDLAAAREGEAGAQAIVGAGTRAVEAFGATRIAFVGGLAEPLRARTSAELLAELRAPLFIPADAAVLSAGGKLSEVAKATPKNR